MKDSDVIDCPVESCEYRGVYGSVKGHYHGKRDGVHVGNFDAVIGGHLEADKEPNDEPNHEPDGGDRDPTLGTSTPEPPQGGSSTEVDLPCGHDSFDPDDVPDEKMVDGKILVLCSECSGVWNASVDQ